MSKTKSNPMLVVATVGLMSFLGVTTETSMNVTFPTLMRTFRVSMSTVQWVTAGYLLAAALVMLTSAYMKHRFTNRALFMSGAALFILGDVICATAMSFPQLLIGRLIQAGCVGLCTPLMVNIILDVVPRAKLGFYIGIANMIVMIAPALGPTFGGAVVAVASWRMIFWSTLPVAVVLLVLGATTIRQYTPTTPYAFDWLRYGVLAASLIAFIVGLNTLSSGHWGLILGLLVVTVIGLASFVRLSRHATRHLFSLAVFRQPAFLLSFLPYIMLQFANVGINFLLPNYVQTVFAASSLAGGLILLPGSLFNGFGQPVYGWLLDKFGGRLPLYLGDLLFTIAVLVLACVGNRLGVVGVTVVYLVFAIGRSMAFGNTVAYGLKLLPATYQQDANALYNTGQQVAGAVGTTVLALMMNMIHTPGAAAAQNVAAGSQLAFALLVLLGVGIAWLFRRLLHLPAPTEKLPTR